MTKSNFELCNEKTITEFIKGEIPKGWDKIASEFKECNKYDNCEEKKLSIRIVGEARKLLVQMMFYCTLYKLNMKETDIRYTAVGSNDFTSDYDLTITGNNAPEVLIDMFDWFINKYKQNIPYSLDVNLYCVGYFSSKDSNTSIPGKCIYFDSNTERENFIISPQQASVMLLSLKYVSLKLLNGLIKVDDNFFKLIGTTREKTTVLKDGLDSKINTELKRKTLKQRYPSFPETNINDKFLETVCKYDMQVENAKKAFKELYSKNKVNVEELMKLIHNALYYSVEAYYTTSTVNVVVIELQTGISEFKNSKTLSRFDYLCSAIENFTDLNAHLAGLPSNVNIREGLLKYSKYVYRVYYSFGKLGYSEYLKKATNIKEKIVAF